MEASIGQRLRTLIEEKGYTPYFVSQKTGISESTLSRILNNASKKPNIKNSEVLAQFFNVSLEWLLNGTGEVNSFESSTAPFANHRVTVRQVTFDNYMEVKYLPVIAQAGYLNGYYDIKEHIDELDTMLVPKEFEKGNYLVVEIAGDSMNDGTTRAICDGDRLLIKELDKTFWKDKLHFRQNLFVIMSNEGIVCKQIIEHNTETHEIRCHSWNENYPNYTINLNDVYKLFYVKKIVERRIRF